MGRLVDDLLRLSRVTRTEMNWTRVDLSRHEDPRFAKMLIPKLQGGAPANVPAPRNDSLLVGKLAPWEKTEDSPPWPL
jgi:hypothetical protein